MMAVLTPEQVAAAAYQAGFRTPAELATATAIALGESGGNPEAYNGAGLDRSHGLFQINLHPAAHAGRWQPEWLRDPVNNATAAWSLYQSSGWRPWQHDGQWNADVARQLPRAQQAAAAVLSGAAPADLAGFEWNGPVGPGVPGGGSSNPLDPRWNVLEGLGMGDLAEQVFAAALGVVFTAAALGLIAMGFWRLTGQQPSDLLSAAGKASTGVGLVAAAV